MKKHRRIRNEVTGLVLTKGSSGRPTLQPPAGYSSWLAYSADMLDFRTLSNEHNLGLQPQWPATVTRAQMREAVASELKIIAGLWCEMERVWGVQGAAREASLPGKKKARSRRS